MRVEASRSLYDPLATMRSKSSPPVTLLRQDWQTVSREERRKGGKEERRKGGKEERRKGDKHFGDDVEDFVGLKDFLELDDVGVVDKTQNLHLNGEAVEILFADARRGEAEAERQRHKKGERGKREGRKTCWTFFLVMTLTANCSPVTL